MKAAADVVAKSSNAPISLSSTRKYLERLRASQMAGKDIDDLLVEAASAHSKAKIASQKQSFMDLVRKHTTSLEAVAAAEADRSSLTASRSDIKKSVAELPADMPVDRNVGLAHLEKAGRTSHEVSCSDCILSA